jgi:hypothetical protein
MPHVVVVADRRIRMPGSTSRAMRPLLKPVNAGPAGRRAPFR